MTENRIIEKANSEFSSFYVTIMSLILIFYGFSGNPRRPVPSFPNGSDYDKSFQLVAETLGDSLKKLFPAEDVVVHQAWSKDKILQELEGASQKIKQVHLVSHGDSTRLSLSYHYDRSSRLIALATKWNADSGNDNERAKKAMLEEDAIVAGLFGNGLEAARLATIKQNHTAEAGWQIWGCYAGYETDTFSGIGHPVIDPYFKRFNLGNPSVPGVAVDIAKNLGVICTAAVDGSGLEFWHGTPARRVLRNDRRTPASKPFWLWNASGSSWVSYDSAGSRLPKPSIFGQERDPSDLPTPRPPRWLTDLFWM